MFFIGDWKESINYKYQVIIEEKIIDLKEINKHVLECILPSFHESLIHSHISSKKTLIYVYENRLLFSEPMSFEIKVSQASKTIF